MCLAIIGELISVERPQEGKRAFATGMVDFGGIQRRVNLGLLSRVKKGDFLLVHAGFAIQKVSAREAREVGRIWAELSPRPSRAEDRPDPKEPRE